jgi:hypothetical protein
METTVKEWSKVKGTTFYGQGKQLNRRDMLYHSYHGVYVQKYYTNRIIHTEYSMNHFKMKALK